MNYELLKQLRDVGYEDGNVSSRGFVFGGEGDHERIAVPTLSGLIAACGEQNLVFWSWYGVWYACKQPTQHWAEQEAQADGKTPEEAVAKLWLALNAKR